MNAIEKIKLSSERVKLIAQLKAQELKGRDKILASRRIQEIVTLLKGGSVTATAEESNSDVDLSPFERIVNDNEITIETLTGAVESTKMLLNGTTAPKIFIDAVGAVSAKIEDGTLMDSVGQAGIDLVTTMLEDIGSHSTSSNNMMLDRSDWGEGVTETKNKICLAFNSAGFNRSENNLVFSLDDSPDFKIDSSKLYSFSISAIKDGETLSSKAFGENVDEAIQWINEFIPNESNKLTIDGTKLFTDDTNSQMLDDVEGAIKSKDLVIDLLNTSGWVHSTKDMYSNAQESFSIRINDSRSSTFDVEIYQNQVCVTTLVTDGSFIGEILDFINEYITVEENKLVMLKNANDRIESTPDLQQKLKPIEQISIIDAVAQGASTSRDNTGENPTQEQLENNDYKTAKVIIAGMHIEIENPIGSVRRGVDENGVPWETTMTAHYGFFENTIGADGDELDVFIVQDIPQDYDGRVFVIAQNDSKGNFDEHKVILGAVNKTQALQIYQSHYDENFTGSNSIIELSVEDFKRRALNQPMSLFDSVQTYMMDSWLVDGHYDLLPVRKLDLSRLDDGTKEPKPSIKEPIVVYVQGAKNYVIHGRKRLDLAMKTGEKFLPSILIDADQGYTKEDIANATRKCGNVVHAEALGALIEVCATKRAEKELM
jgi:hypothetical protein